MERNSTDVQRASNDILIESLGSVNDTYRSPHARFMEDLQGNLFSFVGKLIAEDAKANPGKYDLSQTESFGRLLADPIYPLKEKK